MAEFQQKPAWYITTAIPYVNARPHLGFALEAVLTDALARYARLAGNDVRFLTGTDENAMKNAETAKREGVPVAELVARNAERFRALRDPLNLSFDDFIRTSADPRHFAGVARLWDACAASGDIYKRPYRGLYCLSCEQFYTEDELIDGLCPIHGTPPEVVEEENYFFRLSRYTGQILALLESGALQVVPETRRNEVISFVRGGLEDFSISRSRTRAHGWGLPVPGDPEQVIYVWFDALANYITALDYADDGPLFQRYWQRSAARTHVIGKDVIRFHAVYWPAMLLSARIALPTTVLVHGFLSFGGRKMSKSLGNVVDPVTLAETYGTDALRYYLLREVPPTDDGDFTLERFVQTTNTALADQLGNLLNRVVSMVTRYSDGTVPAPDADVLEDAERTLARVAGQVRPTLSAAMERFNPQEALGGVWALVEEANRYLAQTQPWVLAKTRTRPGEEGERAARRLPTVLAYVAEALRLTAHAVEPFLPSTSDALAERLGVALDDSNWLDAVSWGRFATGARVRTGAVLFPKHEVPATPADEATETV